MKIIGLAGESGTGKTMIGEHLAGRGGEHIDADLVGHELLADSSDVIDAVRRLFGDEVFDHDGVIDRRRIGEKIFGDDRIRKSFNNIIHPAIRRRCGELVADARARGVHFVVVDAALLLDSQMPFEFDLLVALRGTRSVQTQRLLERGGRTEEEIRARLETQSAIEKSFYKADAVIDTDRSRDAVLDEVDGLVDELLK